MYTSAKFTKFLLCILEKEMATHSRVLAWRIPGTGEPGGLPSTGSHRVGHDWSDLAAAAALCILAFLRLSQFNCFLMASLMAQMVKNLPAMWETQVQSPGQEDPLEKDMATHCSILAWRIPWIEEPDELQSMESQRVGHDWATKTFTFFPVCFIEHWVWVALYIHDCLFVLINSSCNPMDYSPLGSSAHGISQARILEWVAIFFFRGTSQTRDRTHVSCIAVRFFTTEPSGRPLPVMIAVLDSSYKKSG